MSSPRRLHVFLLIDALGWRYLDGCEFLDDLLTFRKPLRTVLGFSSGAIPTILTGRSPAVTGHWNLFYYDPKGSPFRWLRHCSFLPERMLNHRVTRKLFKEMGRHLFGMGKNFECSVSPRLMPWFNFVEQRNIYDRKGITGARSIFDELSESGISYRVYSYHDATDREIFTLAKHDIETSDASFFFVYLSEMDLFLHIHCRDRKAWHQRLAWYESHLRQLFGAAQNIDPKFTFTVFSDHGMTLVREHYDLGKEVEALGFSMPTDYLAIYDSTMARFWFSSERCRTTVTEFLRSLACGDILPDHELRELGILFPDRRYGELIFLLHPGGLISSSDFNGPAWMPAGMHGYHPNDSYSDAIFLSNKDWPFEMRTVADVYTSMMEAIGKAAC